MKQWVITVWTCGELFCEGVFDNYYEAVGRMMDRIWEFKESYKEDGDEFEIGIPIVSETDGESQRIDVRYKYHNWEESKWETWHILSVERPKTKHDLTDSEVTE